MTPGHDAVIANFDETEDDPPKADVKLDKTMIVNCEKCAQWINDEISSSARFIRKNDNCFCDYFDYSKPHETGFGPPAMLPKSKDAL